MTIELFPIDRQTWARVADDVDGFVMGQALTLGVENDVLRTVAQQMVGLLNHTGATSPPWSGFLAVDRAQATIVGTCGFKAPPDAQGVVEIAYFTFPRFEGRGVASAMAAGLLESARGEAQVRRFVAHTLPERNASTRLLAKLGFTQTGDAVDPDAGPVWRWERDKH